MLRYFYFALSALGLGLTWYNNFQFMKAGGTLWDFVAAQACNAATLSIGLDITVASIAACVWMIGEGKKLRMKAPWAYVVVTFVIALAFAFPLFLANREKAQRAKAHLT